MKKSELKQLIKEILTETYGAKYYIDNDIKSNFEEAKKIANEIWGNDVKEVIIDGERSGYLCYRITTDISQYYNWLMRNRRDGLWYYADGNFRDKTPKYILWQGK